MPQLLSVVKIKVRNRQNKECVQSNHPEGNGEDAMC